MNVRLIKYEYRIEKERCIIIQAHIKMYKNFCLIKDFYYSSDSSIPSSIHPYFKIRKQVKLFRKILKKKLIVYKLKRNEINK